LARELFAEHAKEYAQITPNSLHSTPSFWPGAAPTRRAGIPGIGLVIASLLVVKTPDAQLRSGRQYADWLGLTPKDHSTASKTRLDIITRAGDDTLRSLPRANGIRRQLDTVD
jgi:transposase